MKLASTAKTLDSYCLSLGPIIGPRMERKQSNIAFMCFLFGEEPVLGREGLLVPVSINDHQYHQALYSKAHDSEEGENKQTNKPRWKVLAVRNVNIRDLEVKL